MNEKTKTTTIKTGDQTVTINVNTNTDDTPKPSLITTLTSGCFGLAALGCGLGCLVLIVAMLVSGSAIAAVVKFLM